MFLIAFCIHLVFFVSLIDLYFQSPIVQNVPEYEPHHGPVADRLVLFILDGLNADSFLHNDNMIKLRRTAVFEGKWGISKTQPPTESRPGHIAVLAGFYEDPSAILTGWKRNLVIFDSVLNQTKFAWTCGENDIADIFTKGTKDDHIIVKTVDSSDKSFSTLADTWVFRDVKNIFEKAKNESYLEKKFMNQKIIFVLYLPGIDEYVPNTDAYLEALKLADTETKEIENIVRNFYNDDKKTTFIMTSDHGKTVQGNHGGGSSLETETPFVIWGAGITPLAKNDLKTYKGELLNKNRCDINQVDLAPLMSSILSVPVPANSLGVLPLEILDIPLKDKAKALYSNSRQMANQYYKKRLDIEKDVMPFLYYPYKPLNTVRYQRIINDTEKLLANDKYDKAIQSSKELINLSLSGLQYYLNYYKAPLLTAVVLSFLGWICGLLKWLLQQLVLAEESVTIKGRNLHLTTGLLFVWTLLSAYLIFAQNLPSMFYIYFTLPAILWWYVVTPIEFWKQCFIWISCKNHYKLWPMVLVYSIGTIAMSLSYTYRWMLTVPLTGMAIWPLMSSIGRGLCLPVLGLWFGSCFLLCVFTFIPVVGDQVCIACVIIAGIIWLVVYGAFTWKINQVLIDEAERKRELLLNSSHIALILLALHNVFVQSRIMEQALPTNFYFQITAWVIAGISLLVPFLHTKRLVCRLQAINSSIFTFYMLLSVIHEGLFLVTLIINASCWIFIEFKMMQAPASKDVKLNKRLKRDTLEPQLEGSKVDDELMMYSVTTTDVHGKSLQTSSKESIPDPDCPLVGDMSQLLDLNYDRNLQKTNSIISEVRVVNCEDFRRAFFHLLYIMMAFFGTGNIASLVNLNDCRWVALLANMHGAHPYLKYFTIAMKMLCPFVCVASGFRAVEHVTQAPRLYLYVIVLIFSNVMGIQLLFNVRNTGSWLEIGTSVFHFAMALVTTLFIAFLNILAKFYTDRNFHFNV